MDKEDETWIDKIMKEVDKMKEDKMDEGYKYTLSFINNQPGLVIRGDHTLQLENAITAVVPVFRKFKNALIAVEKKQEQAFQESKVVPVEDNLLTNCVKHGIKMIQGTSKTKKDEFGEFKTYWYHRNTQGQMCFGDGWIK